MRKHPKPKIIHQTPSHALLTFPNLDATNWLKNPSLDQRLLAPLPFQKAVFLEQIHSSNLTHLKTTSPPRILPQKDGALTSKKGLLLVVRTADCIPALATIKKDGKILAVGTFHAGREGLNQNLPQKFLKKAKQAFGSNLTLDLFLGPSICSSCYTLSPNHPKTQKLLKNLNKKTKSQITKLKGEKLHLDLLTWCKLQLQNSPFPLTPKIKHSPLCPKKEPSLFSYRAGDTKKTNAYCIGLKKQS